MTDTEVLKLIIAATMQYLDGAITDDELAMKVVNILLGSGHISNT